MDTLHQHTREFEPVGIEKWWRLIVTRFGGWSAVMPINFVLMFVFFVLCGLKTPVARETFEQNRERWYAREAVNNAAKSWCSAEIRMLGARELEHEKQRAALSEQLNKALHPPPPPECLALIARCIAELVPAVQQDIGDSVPEDSILDEAEKECQSDPANQPPNCQ